MLELKQNNLYSNGQVVNYVDGSKILERVVRNLPETNEDKQHVVALNDRLDLIAWKYYKDVAEDASKYWWLIADANNIFDPLDLSDYIGKTLRVPDYKAFTANK